MILLAKLAIAAAFPALAFAAPASAQDSDSFVVNPARNSETSDADGGRVPGSWPPVIA